VLGNYVMAVLSAGLFARCVVLLTRLFRTFRPGKIAFFPSIIILLLAIEITLHYI
jgi:hypothetical protein